jgi:hypothetical protein
MLILIAASHSQINQTILRRTLCLYRCADDKPSPLNYEVSKEKAKTLGLDFTPLEVSVKDTLESLKEKGFLNV